MNTEGISEKLDVIIELLHTLIEHKHEHDDVVTQLSYQQGLEPATCDKCGKTFANVYTLQTHIDNVHNKKNKKKYQCPKCNNKVSSIYYLKAHMKKIHGSDDDVINEIINTLKNEKRTDDSMSSECEGEGEN